MTTSLFPSAQDVLHFWFGDGLEPGARFEPRHEIWFGGGAELDQRIRERFGALVEQAIDGGLRDWEDPIHARLALVLLLDQFPRNVYRGQARAFAGDARAQRLTRQAFASGMDEPLATVGRVFLAMPLMHAEDIALQHESVQCFQHLLETCAPEQREMLAGNLQYAELHRDIVARFGRFPHRNAALGRPSTPAEIEFLRDGPRFGQ